MLLTIIVADRRRLARAVLGTEDKGQRDEGPIMAVDPELLEILACPNCKTKVELVKGGTALKCPQCRRVYPIKDDIPVMLIDEATIEP